MKIDEDENLDLVKEKLDGECRYKYWRYRKVGNMGGIIIGR